MLATSFSAVLVRASTAPAMVLVLYRVIMASLLLCPLILTKQRNEWKDTISKRMYLLPMLSGMFLGLHFSSYFTSLHYTSIASAVVLADLEVFFVAFAMLVILKERIPRKAWVGILLAFLGSLTIAATDAGGNSGSNVLKGDFLALLGACCMSVYTMIGKVCRKSMTTTVYTFLVYFSAAVTVLTILLFRGVPLYGYDPINYWIAFGLAVVCTLFGHSVFSWGLKYEKPSFISTAKMLDPVFASSLGVIFLQEIPPVMVIVGGCVVIFGIYYYSKHQ